MGDEVIRHLVAALATIITVLAYYSGYISGPHGWWWTVFGCVIIYGGVFRLINK